MDAHNPISVVLAEDDALLRQGLVGLLSAIDDVEVVAEAADLPSLKRSVDDHRPDVVVTDIRMPPTGSDEGVQAAAYIHEHHPETGVVVLSQYANPEYALALLESGTGRRAYLLKERVRDVTELIHAVREVHAGGSVIDPEVVSALVAANRTRPESLIDFLTPRELEVLGEMAQGKSNAAIAESLVLSERAVEKHSTSIFAKLGLSDEPDRNRRVSAVLIYLGEGRDSRTG